jgi:hypothetical protein
MSDIRDTEPPLEGQKGFKGPAFLAKLFTSHIDHRTNRDDKNQQQ